MVGSIFPVEIQNITVRKRGKVLIDDVSLSLPDGGVTIVIGPNGAGKSTLLRTLHGMERMRGGHIKWAQNKDLTRQRQAFVFQTPILMRRTVLDNVAYPIELRGTSKSNAQAAALKWLSQVGLKEHTSLRASELSGGERQKMALARALISEPELLFLDEPCANLDGRATREIETILRQTRDGGTRLIMATHDMGQAKRLATDVIFMNKGRLLEHTKATTFFEAPQTAQARAFINGDIVE